MYGRSIQNYVDIDAQFQGKHYSLQKTRLATYDGGAVVMVLLAEVSNKTEVPANVQDEKGYLYRDVIPRLGFYSSGAMNTYEDMY